MSVVSEQIDEDFESLPGRFCGCDYHDKTNGPCNCVESYVDKSQEVCDDCARGVHVFGEEEDEDE
jgi:hypothetical protein